MAKKRKKQRSDRSHSSLADHQRQKKVLTPPLKTIGPVQLTSWRDRRLPEMLWAALLAAALPRDRYLELFRRVSEGAEQYRESKLFIAHSTLQAVAASDFAQIFDHVVDEADAREALRPLALFPELPDAAHWLSRVGPLADADVGPAWQRLGAAIAQCLDHQSEASTDIRWLKLRFLIIQHRIRFPESMKEHVVDILDFPNRGDLRRVRPSIRSLEIGLDNDFLKAPERWAEDFWRLCWERTQCFAMPRKEIVATFNHSEIVEKWANIYRACAEHCAATAKTTAIDVRHDGVFGLALYGLTLVASLFRPHSTRPAGRLTLRALVECYLTLAYLVKKDESSLWKAYRTYGGGQAKLAFLKLFDAPPDELPGYVDLQTLEHLANEDVWQEFLEINLGHWANKDLRKMSEEIGVKGVYDKYYTWPSTFVHAQWPAVRNTVFDLCLNPLHRLHRIPRPPRTDLEDVIVDELKLGNLILDLVNEAYPSFNHRFKSTPGGDSPSSGGEGPEPEIAPTMSSEGNT